MAVTITNYDGGVATSPRVVAVPENVQQLQSILRDPDRFPSPVRAMGTFHSLTPCPASTGTVVRMNRMTRILDIDTNDMTMTAEAGLQLGVAAAELRRRGLQFVLNIEIGNATLGSLACCHSKDAMDGVDHGQVSSYVTRIKWVDPNGELAEADEDKDPDLLQLARSSYGLCGVVYEVTLRIKPVEIVKFDYHVHPSRSLTQQYIADMATTNEAMVCWTIGRTTIVQTRNQAATLARSSLYRLRRLAWTRVGAFVGRNLRRQLPPGPVRNTTETVWLECEKLVYRALSAVGGFSLYAPDKIMNYTDAPAAARYAFTFWAFPFDRWVENLNDYLDFSEDYYRRTGFRCNMPLGSYFIKQDEGSLLSYTFDGDVLSLDPIHAYREEDEEDWFAFLRAFNQWAAQRGGIPLLNQSPFVEPAHVAAAYGERWQRFADWLAEVDPDRRMQNEFFAALLPQ